MGAGASAKQMKGTETEIINLMMPLYVINSFPFISLSFSFHFSNFISLFISFFIC